MSNKLMIGLAVVSVLLTGLILTSYASLGDVLGEDFDTNVEEFQSADLSAAQSGTASSASTPQPPPQNYASEHMKVFSLSSGLVEVFGFAPNSSNGILAGRFFADASLLRTDPPGQGRRFEGDLGWHIEVYEINTDLFGRSTFQVNLYDAAGVLRDDGYRFRAG